MALPDHLSLRNRAILFGLELGSFALDSPLVVVFDLVFDLEFGGWFRFVCGVVFGIEFGLLIGFRFGVVFDLVFDLENLMGLGEQGLPIKWIQPIALWPSLE
ncbi:hypothetical protein KM043_009246 [Ampulex compressa]|nr:hypothetical protein KM043_009246 [Ampulex compressa]